MLLHQIPDPVRPIAYGHDFFGFGHTPAIPFQPEGATESLRVGEVGVGAKRRFAPTPEPVPLTAQAVRGVPPSWWCRRPHLHLLPPLLSGMDGSPIYGNIEALRGPLRRGGGDGILHIPGRLYHLLLLASNGLPQPFCLLLTRVGADLHQGELLQRLYRFLEGGLSLQQGQHLLQAGADAPGTETQPLFERGQAVVTAPTEVVEPLQGDSSQQGIYMGGAHPLIFGGLTARAGHLFLGISGDMKAYKGSQGGIAQFLDGLEGHLFHFL